MKEYIEMQILIRQALECLVWASGAFDTESKSKAWAEHGRPVVNKLIAWDNKRGPYEGS